MRRIARFLSGFLPDHHFLKQAVDEVTDTVDLTWPSEWAEANRYLPASTTSLPGPFSFGVCPYMREIVDSMDARVDVHEVSFMKGAQICATVGALENTLGWLIGHVKSSPVMFMSAQDDVVKIRMDENVTKMIQESGLADELVSTDDLSGRKAAKTDKKMSWRGGGYLVPTSARSVGKLRSFSIRYLLEDEVDGYPLTVGVGGKEGDPCELAENRCKGFRQTYKVLRLSTPLDKETSRILPFFKAGDQRRYFVPCLGCGEMQTLKFQGKTDEGVKYGLTWETEKDGRTLVPGSVKYECRYCGHAHVNEHKSLMLPRGEWRATAKPVHPKYRSYHMSGLYSPVGMFDWEGCVLAYLRAFDPASKRWTDIDKTRTFYNTVLGEAFEDRGTKLTHKTVSEHRRRVYKYGEIPNGYMRDHAGGPASLVLATVDVHKHNLKVGVFAFAPGGRMFVIDYLTFEGDTETTDDPGTWGELNKLVREKIYTADDGRRYAVALTLVDAGYQAESVYTFCKAHKAGVMPIAGRGEASGHSLPQEFRHFTTKTGLRGAHLGVDLFKDRLSARLKHKWNREGFMPEGHFNVPEEMSDESLRELTREFKKVEYDKKTKRRKYMWVRQHTQVRQELWDLTVYAMGGLHLVAHDVLVSQHGMEKVDWAIFWELLEKHRLFYRPPAKTP